MKTIKFVLVVILLISFGSASFAQMHDHSSMGMGNASSTKSETFKVWGNCDLCKARIEKAAKIDGVTSAVWNTDSKKLAVVYNPSKVKSEDVQKKIAAAGHDTEKFKADDKAYANLPGCCKYERRQ